MDSNHECDQRADWSAHRHGGTPQTQRSSANPDEVMRVAIAVRVVGSGKKRAAAKWRPGDALQRCLNTNTADDLLPTQQPRDDVW